MSKVGIEIEVESRSVSQTDINEAIKAGVLRTWALDTNEGSLRGGPTGWEIKTTGHGIPYESVPSVLSELYPILRGSSGVWRSAVHVHVDVSSLVMRQRALALALAYVADYDIFAQVSPERVESNFCVPLEHKTPVVMESVIELAHDRSVGGYGKYSSVNINTMRTFGTYEFRHMKTPECDDSVPSIQRALSAVQHFVDLAHRVISLVNYVDMPATYEDVVQGFTLLSGNKYLWKAIGIRPSPEALLAVTLALRAGATLPREGQRRNSHQLRYRSLEEAASRLFDLAAGQEAAPTVSPTVSASTISIPAYEWTTWSAAGPRPWQELPQPRPRGVR